MKHLTESQERRKRIIKVSNNGARRHFSCSSISEIACIRHRSHLSERERVHRMNHAKIKRASKSTRNLVKDRLDYTQTVILISPLNLIREPHSLMELVRQ